ncbi:hypothetical protein M406DRAFT_256295 [Cryphonectria parasitica EP155]|uniref:RRM domain-containing protein n=1 Tax=Cryphonectria parasitica (strain ATCC 38755 / EP155) TaxID=660469 RepID=A0A9P4Y3K9_CRYP1|nr:uncharacterized protein M406DRAFT_256295 [Cryphonectria parasitica EP155]KAF3765835.1 hypothetical protein M406DRAFT_256295 [Cryphonectria parasitica EP155]
MAPELRPRRSKAEQATPKATGSTVTEPKETPKSASKATQSAPVSAAKTATKTPKSAKKSGKKAEKEPVEKKDTVKKADAEVIAPHEEEHSSSEEEADEQTKALVQTIDSGDEDGPGSGVVLFEEGQDVGKIPELSNKEKKAAKKALAASKQKEDPGVVYVGRLPHGFYEHEMKSYFSQFGPIRNLRVSRNKKTGRAKHFAFVEFEELSTAEIVAKTMDNYLLFGHILKCSVIPKAQVHDELFKGANKRFKPVPWNKMEGKQMERPLLEDKWARKINKEKKRRAERAKKLEAVGYEFDTPEVMDVNAIPAITAPEATESKTLEAVQDAPTKTIEAPPAVEIAEGEVAEKEQEATPKPAKRTRGRPAKTPQKATKGAATPRKTRG